MLVSIHVLELLCVFVNQVNLSRNQYFNIVNRQNKEICFIAQVNYNRNLTKYCIVLHITYYQKIC